MVVQRPMSARRVAWQVLNQFDPKRDYAGAVLDTFLTRTQERQRATDLVFGTIRNRIAIDTVIEVFSGRRVRRIPAGVLNIIRVAVYELAYNPQTPDYSIVNEAAENAKEVGVKQSGFVNAVLREIARHIISRQAPLDEAYPLATLPQTPSTGCRFDTQFLPDAAGDQAGYLSTCFSLPNWLVSGWLTEYGFEAAKGICFASNRRPSIYIRPNSLKATAEKLSQLLRQENIDTEIVSDATICRREQCPMIRLTGPRAIEDVPGFAEGLFTVQDISASQAVSLLNPPLRGTILDMCAAPGVKTTQLAEATGDAAEIIATDINSERLEKVKENAARLGVKSITTVAYDRLFENSQFQILNSKFDVVLLDVPCSNTGVLARRVEVRLRIEPHKVEELANIQRAILDKVARLGGLKPTGSICYSTCSIEKIENAAVVHDFLKQNRDFKLETENLILPSAEHFDHDGGYVAILRRTAQ